MNTKPPFRWKKFKSLKDGYGNRWALICNGCDATIVKGDYGNANGERYFHLSAEAAAKQQHLTTCAKARRLRKIANRKSPIVNTP